MNSLLADSLRSLRLLRKAPGFALTVVGVLALGVGANTAIFSVIRGILLNPFPYTDSDRILFVGSTREGENGQMPVTYPDFLDWRKQARRFEQLAYASNRSLILTGSNEAATLNGASISASAWPLLGLSPTIGRTFTEDEDRPGADRVCVISASLWQTRFGADEKVLGRALTLDGQSYTVIGVMPPRFKFWGADVWLPVGLEADSEMMHSRVLRMSTWVVAKMKPGVSLADATAELNVIAARIAGQYPDSNKGLGVTARLLSESVTGPVRRPLFVLLASVGFVLLIACANVANLLLARSAARQREFAIRAALGGGRARLIAQVLMEVLPLALLGGLAGVLLAVWGLDSLIALLPSQAVPAEASVQINAPVMFFSLGVCTGTMLLFALVPALDVSRAQSAGALHEGARGSSGRRTGFMRSALIVAEVSLSLVLLVGAGLLIRSFAKLQSVDPGFDPHNLLVMSLQLPEARYRHAEDATQFFRDVVERVRHVPGVKVAAAAGNMPFLWGSDLPLLTPDRTYTDLNQLESAQFTTVLGDTFAAQGLRVVKGRTFDSADTAGSEPVIILNEAAVKKYLPPGADPLNQRVMLGIPANLIKPGMLPPGLDKFQWTRVVGVVQSARHFGLQSDPPPAAYLPVDQSWNDRLVRSAMFVLMRTEGDPTNAIAGARAAVASLDRDQPIGRIGPMQAIIDESLRPAHFMMVLLGLFAGVAFTLAVVGVYGVVAWNVTQRTRELGIRAALGATRDDVMRLVIGQGMRVVLVGLALGIALALLIARVLQTMLYETSALDPWTFSIVGAVLAIVALLACLLPALRASRVSPLEALRAE